MATPQPVDTSSFTPEQMQAFNNANALGSGVQTYNSQVGFGGLPNPGTTPTPAPQAVNTSSFTPQQMQAFNQANALGSGVQTYGTPMATQTAPLAQGSPQQTGANAQQMAQSGLLTVPQNGSVVDLLNMVGQDSSLTARQQLASLFGIANYKGTAQQNTELAQKYVDAYNAKKGSQVPQNGAEARAALGDQFALSQNVPQGTAAQQFMDVFGGMSPVESQIFQQLSGYLSTSQTKQSLTDLFTQEMAAQGIPEMQMELADINAIMSGTEQDIRDEISNAGAFATESQVQALTGARNKVLLQRANYLTDAINLKNDYVAHIVSLTQADRDAVSKDIEQKLGITNMVLDMTRNMENAARGNYENLVNKVGYAGLAQALSQSPQQQAQAERALGLPSGSLSIGSPLIEFERQLQEGSKELQGVVDTQVQGQSGYSNISQVTGKPLTEGERVALGYADRLKEADAVIDNIGSMFTGVQSYIGQLLPNVFKSTDRQKYEQAQRNFVNAVLRKESGAVISPQEFDNAQKQYFPQPGDTAGVVKQKQQNRETAIESMLRAGGQATGGIANDPLGIL